SDIRTNNIADDIHALSMDGLSMIQYRPRYSIKARAERMGNLVPQGSLLWQMGYHILDHDFNRP
ncbi:MAG TPA: hypothetical protein PKA06_03655, partial [Gemmatales bacterium]|nr:hypothetical protein [Gemmatales bacterium]